MTSDVEHRVRKANPISRVEQLDRMFGEDASDQLLRQIRLGRVVHMAKSDDSKKWTRPDETVGGPSPEGGPNASRRGWLLAAGIVVVGLAIAAASVWSLSDSTDVASTSETSVALSSSSVPTTTVTRSPVEMVMASFEAYNAGDMEAWLGHFSADAVIFGEHRDTAPGVYSPQFAANTKITVEVPCRLGEPSASGEESVICSYTQTDDFHAVAGVSIPFETAFVINGGGLIRLASPPGQGYQTTRALFTQFYHWLGDAHPDIFTQIKPGPAQDGQDGSLGRPPETPENMRIAIVYVDEFVAQSDDYPPPEGS